MEQQQQQEQQNHQQYDSFHDELLQQWQQGYYDEALAYQQQHARPQQRRSAAASGTRRKRADAGVPRGPRRNPGAEGRQQQPMWLESVDEAAPMAAEQPFADQGSHQLHPPAVWQQLAQQLQQLEQLQQSYAADHAARPGAEAPASEWRQRSQRRFAQAREAAPAHASILLAQQAAPPGESSCSVCQNTCSCTIR